MRFNDSSLRSNKAKIRKFIKDEIDTIQPRRMLSLANLNFEVETYAIQNYGTQCVSVENSLVIYQEQLKLLRDHSVLRNSIKLKHAKLSQIIHQYNHFDFMWVDLCGGISIELITILEKIRVERFAITVARGREYYKIGEDRNVFYTNLFLYYGYKTLQSYEYKDTAPMSVFFLEKM